MWKNRNAHHKNFRARKARAPTHQLFMSDPPPSPKSCIRPCIDRYIPRDLCHAPAPIIPARTRHKINDWNLVFIFMYLVSSSFSCRTLCHSIKQSYPLSFLWTSCCSTYSLISFAGYLFHYELCSCTLAQLIRSSSDYDLLNVPRCYTRVRALSIQDKVNTEIIY